MAREVNEEAEEKLMNSLTETIAREKAVLHARLERIRAEQRDEPNADAKRVGKLYEVFKAVGE